MGINLPGVLLNSYGKCSWKAKSPHSHPSRLITQTFYLVARTQSSELAFISFCQSSLRSEEVDEFEFVKQLSTYDFLPDSFVHTIPSAQEGLCMIQDSAGRQILHKINPDSLRKKNNPYISVIIAPRWDILNE